LTSETPRFEWNALCVDCAPDDFEKMVAFYCDLTGWRVWDKEPRWASIGLEEGMMILVQAEEWYAPPVWPEKLPAQTKMMHMEVKVDDVVAAVARAIEIGAREAPNQPADRDPARLRVMLDPAGHPFCLWS
jgi:catechol 2,3-dioxygenase-like lactoylglutathione lyase family enzyme